MYQTFVCNQYNAYDGARYYDARLSRWISADPPLATGEYFPVPPVNDDAKKKNENLPGMGGVFNAINLDAYQYAGMNPIKYLDPDGNVILAMESAKSIIDDSPDTKYFNGNIFLVQNNLESNIKKIEEINYPRDIENKMTIYQKIEGRDQKNFVKDIDIIDNMLVASDLGVNIGTVNFEVIAIATEKTDSDGNMIYLAKIKYSYSTDKGRYSGSTNSQFKDAFYFTDKEIKHDDVDQLKNAALKIYKTGKL